MADILLCEQCTDPVMCPIEIACAQAEFSRVSLPRGSEVSDKILSDIAARELIAQFYDESTGIGCTRSYDDTKQLISGA